VRRTRRRGTSIVETCLRAPHGWSVGRRTSARLRCARRSSRVLHSTCHRLCGGRASASAGRRSTFRRESRLRLGGSRRRSFSSQHDFSARGDLTTKFSDHLRILSNKKLGSFRTVQNVRWYNSRMVFLSKDAAKMGMYWLIENFIFPVRKEGERLQFNRFEEWILSLF